MDFEDFVNNLNSEDRENFEKYSVFRGKQQYKIIFYTLAKENEKVSYLDVNSFIRYDKALKDCLFKYLGSLEEYIKTYIFDNFDFDKEVNLKKEKYRKMRELPKIVKIQNNNEITELYKRFALNFGDIIKFLNEYDPNNFDKKIENVKLLRDKVMHHLPLLFDSNCSSTTDVTKAQINDLASLLPNGYNLYMIKEIEKITKNTYNNIKTNYQKYLLKEV